MYPLYPFATRSKTMLMRKCCLAEARASLADAMPLMPRLNAPELATRLLHLELLI